MKDQPTDTKPAMPNPATREECPYRPAQPNRGRRWLRNIGLLVVAVIVFLVIEHFDIAMMRLRYAVIGDEPRGFLKHILNGFREFGQTLSVIVAIVIVVTYDRRWKTIIVSLLLAEIVGAMVYNSGKLLVERYRPQIAIQELADPPTKDALEALSRFTSADTWQGWQPGNTKAARQSFPSGHSAGAFILAGVLACFYPKSRAMLFTLATGCALSRYLGAVHWLSDCWAGAVIGYAMAILTVNFCCRNKISPSQTATGTI